MSTNSPEPEEGHSPGEQPLEEVLERFRFQCPECKRELSEYTETCPKCGASLLNVFSAMYQPPVSPLSKVIAWTVLIVFLGSMFVVFAMVVSRG